jgi:phosphatidylserine decarboxylase
VAHFAFGGSIMTTLFHAGTMDFDYDLIQHSQGMCETLCRFGSSLGRVRRPAAGGTS